MNQWFEHLTEQIYLASDEQSAKHVLDRLTLQAGFRFFTYASFQSGTYRIISSYPEDWIRRYIVKSFIDIDPTMIGLRQREGAFAWAAPTGRVSKEQRQFFTEAAEFGIRSGISVPIATGFGQTAILTLTSEDADYAESRKFSPIIAAAAVGQVHSHLDAMQIVPRLQVPMRLKVDELTCLKWSAEGKSMRAIAVIEDTSYANVCFRLRNAKQALGATTLPQATAIAKALRLI